jgi:antitoxin MazE
MDSIVPTEANMQVAIRTIGNSKGVVLPKSLLVQVGLEDQTSADIAVENGAIVLRRSVKAARSGWAQAAKALAAEAQDAMLLGEFGNASDEVHEW